MTPRRPSAICCDLRAGEQLDAFVDEGLLHDVGGILGVIAQNIRAALDERDPRCRCG